MKVFLFFSMFLIITLQSYSQNITNTLGTGGVYTIKDASNSFLIVTQSTGEVNIINALRLENTSSSTTGIIYKGTDWFLHNFKPSSNNGRNTFLGINSGNFTMGGGLVAQASYNTGIGYFSLMNLTLGAYNTAVGYSSLFSNSTGSDNVAVGCSSLLQNFDGDGNVAIGRYAMYKNTSGYNNVSVGYYAGYDVSSGSNLTLLGYNAQPSGGSATNEITLGNNSVTSLRCNVTTITALSDARDKRNITDLTLGLDFITKLKPRQFNWDKREWYDDNKSDGSNMQDIPTAGFIAQELDEVQTNYNAEWLNLVYKSNPEKLEATPGNLLPVMVKAIQELKEENDKLKAELESLKSLSTDITQIKKMVEDIKPKGEKSNQLILNDTKQ